MPDDTISKVRAGATQKMMEGSTAAAVEVPPGSAWTPNDILYQLWFEQFKQINTLSVAATGGALILLQMDLVPAAVVPGLAILAMAAAVLVAMNGQNLLVEDVAKGVAPSRGVRAARGIAGALLAGGAGAFISFGYFS